MGVVVGVAVAVVVNLMLGNYHSISSTPNQSLAVIGQLFYLLSLLLYLVQLFSHKSNKAHLAGTVVTILVLAYNIACLWITDLVSFSDYMQLLSISLLSPFTENIDNLLQDEEANHGDQCHQTKPYCLVMLIMTVAMAMVIMS